MDNEEDREFEDLSGQVIGSFLLVARIAHGGSSDVYRAVEIPSQREAAVKILRDSVRQKRRFEREIQLAAALGHPLTARMYNCGRVEERPWLAMELVQGVDMESWIQADGRINVDRFLRLFDELVKPVAYLNDLGIVHRDLKPSNVMVLKHDNVETPMLIDLGIAKVPDSLTQKLSAFGIESEPRREVPPEYDGPITKEGPITSPRKGMGTVQYMPPEQWADSRNVTPASDSYALGVLSYQALSGHLPFEGETAQSFRHQHFVSSIPSIGGDLAKDSDPVFRKALAKDPADRYATAPELAAALHAARDAMLARPIKRARRIIASLSAALAFAVIIVASLGFLNYRSGKNAELAEAKASAAVQVKDAEKTQSEVDAGRTALRFDLPHPEQPLGEAYRRGDHSKDTTFMVERALQPRLSSLAELKSSGGGMWSASFSPDGSKIATADDQNVQIWDAASYQRLQLLPHHVAVHDAAFSADGALLVTRSLDAVRTWDVAHGSLLHELKGVRAGNYAVAKLSPNGRYVAAIDSAAATLDVWDASSGTLLTEVHGDDTGLPSIDFSADSEWLAAAGDHVVYLFEVPTWKQTRVIPQAGARSVAFAPTKAQLLVGTVGGDVSIWNVPQVQRNQHLAELIPTMSAIAWSQDGRLVAAGNAEGAVQLWSADSGERRGEFVMRRSPVLSLEIDPTSSSVLTTHADGTVVIADIAAGVPTDVFDGAKDRVRVAHFAPRGDRVIAADWSGTAMVLDTTPTYRRWSSARIDRDCRLATSEPIEQRIVAAACHHHATQVWDVAADRLLLTLPGSNDIDDSPVTPAVSPSMQLAAIARGTDVEVYDIATGQLTRKIRHGAVVSVVGFTSTDDVLSGAVNGELLLTRADGAMVMFPNAGAGIDSAIELSDGRIAAADTKQQLHIFNASGISLAKLALPIRGTLHVHGTRAVLLQNFAVDPLPPVLLDLEKYQIIAQLDLPSQPVWNVRWIADDQFLTAGFDSGICRWDGVTGKLLQRYQGIPNNIFDAAITSDGLVVAGDVKGRLRFWDASSGDELWALQAHRSRIEAIHVEDGGIITFSVDGSVAHWKLPKLGAVLAACRAQPACAIVAP